MNDTLTQPVHNGNESIAIRTEAVLCDHISRMDDGFTLDRSTMMAYILCDLRHLCDRWGLDFSKKAEEGRQIYSSEMADYPPAPLVLEKEPAP